MPMLLNSFMGVHGKAFAPTLNPVDGVGGGGGSIIMGPSSPIFSSEKSIVWPNADNRYFVMVF